MTKIESHIGTELYRIELSSASGNIIVADEPVDKGGQDKGFSPKELLLSSLAACISATVRMYADRKKWPLEEVRTFLELDTEQAGKTVILKKVEFVGDLSDEQRERLLTISGLCPIHKILTNPIEVETLT